MIDINNLIFNHMKKTVHQKNKTSYPYRMLFSRLVRNKGTILNSEKLNMTPIISVETLVELKMKNDDGNKITRNITHRIVENPAETVVETSMARVYKEDYSDDDKTNYFDFEKKILNQNRRCV